MVNQEQLNEDQRSLSPLPEELRKGLIAVAFFGFLSFILSVGLFLVLLYRLIAWRRKHKASNQFVILIFNLVLADIQQSIAFLLNAQWLYRNEISVGTSTCFAQGWFVSTGDLASGVFCVAIGVHTFFSVISNYRLPMRWFLAAILACWMFIYGVSVIGIGLYPDNIFVRAGAWCWVNSDYGNVRLWTHYFFIFVAEFGLLVIYGLMYSILIKRLRAADPESLGQEKQKQARQAAKLMVIYPLVYVVCTLPLASARMANMVGEQPSYSVLTFAGAMITSNGWLDVLLYTLTRRIMLFADEPPEDSMGLSTFYLPFHSESSRFGTKTTIVALAHTGNKSYSSRTNSTDQLFGFKGVKAERTVEVRSDPVELADIAEIEAMERAQKPATPKERLSFESKSVQSFELEFRTE